MPDVQEIFPYQIIYSLSNLEEDKLVSSRKRKIFKLTDTQLKEIEEKFEELN